MARIEVGRGRKYACSASDTALHFDEEWGRSSASELSLPASLEDRLGILESNGFMERRGRELVLPYALVTDLEDEDRAPLESLAPPSPLSLELRDQGFLGSPAFRIETIYYLGAKQIEVNRTGPFVRFHNRTRQLPWKAFTLLQNIDAMNRLETGEKADLGQILRHWGIARAQAKDAGLDLSHYLEEEEVVVADRVAPTFVESSSGHTSIVPEIADVPQDLFQPEYLRHGDVPSRYAISDARGHKVRVVLEPEVRSVLQAWSSYRRLSPRERDRILADPRLLLPEDVSSEVIDLSQYGPRVKAIGEYPTTIRPYVSSGQRWDDVGESDVSPEPEAKRFGLDLTYLDGDGEHCDFESIEEAEQLLTDAREAIHADQPVVDFRGKKLRADEALVNSLGELVENVSGRRDSETETTQAPGRRPRGVGLLIYTNEEDVDFAVSPDDHKAIDTDHLIPPAALLPHVELKPHQQQGVAWLVHAFCSGRPGVLLADDMGLGKTLQTLTFLAWLIENPLRESLGSIQSPWDPILIVAPPTLLSVWKEEVERFFHLSIFMPYQLLTTEEARKLRTTTGRESESGKPVLDVPRIREHRLVVTSYQTLSAYGLSLGQVGWSIVVSDEAQALKDPNTRTSIVFKALKSGFCMALTGTPVETRLLDVWNLFDALHPGLLGSAKQFSSRYEPKDADGRLSPSADAARELAGEIGVAGSGAISSGARLLRRTKEDELADLPRKHVHRIESVLSQEQRNTYLSLIQSFRRSSRRGKSLEMLSQLNRLCQHPRLVGGDILAGRPQDLVRDCPKLESLLGILDEIAKRREKVLIFANFRDAQMVIKRVIDHRYKVEAGILNGDRAGGTKRVHEARTDMIRRFEAKPGFNAMIVSPRVGGVGLTITGANHVVHYGRWWNPAREDQCTDRVYRIGQLRDVHVYRLVASDPERQFRTFDERLDELLEKRRVTAENFLMPAADESSLARDLTSAMTADAADETPEDAADRAIRTSETVAGLNPEGFEAMAAALFEAQGYETYLTPAAGDGGIDVLAFNAGEILLVQCKHTASRHALDAAVLRELDDGELYYREKILPSGFTKGRRVRCVLMTNAPRSRALLHGGRSADVEIIAEQDLHRLLKRYAVTPSSIGRWLGTREESLDALRAALGTTWRSGAGG